MHFRAELRCYLCSRSTATLDWEGDVASIVSVSRPGLPTSMMSSQTARAVRCVRCGGPSFIEEIERIREMPIITIEPAKRGRPRKADKERELALERDHLARIA